LEHCGSGRDGGVLPNPVDDLKCADVVARFSTLITDDADGETASTSPECATSAGNDFA
jgi:hypothetical protein